MMYFAPLWADNDWIKLVIPIAAFAFWLLNRLLGGESPAARQAKARQQARANPARPPAEKQRVEDEVGEFLRRAQQQRAVREPRAPPASQPPRPPKPVRKSLSAADRRADSPVSLSGTTEAAAAPAPPTGDSDVFGKWADRSGTPTEVAQADAAMQSHLAQVFDHTVGTLADVSGTATVSTSQSHLSTASDVAAILRDPQRIREAIIVSEILRRPEERW